MIYYLKGRARRGRDIVKIGQVDIGNH